MKTFKLLVFGLMLMLASSAQSQVSVNVHIGTAPAWGPSGYNDVRYYYLPDVEAYYDVQTSMFIYISGNRWIRRTYLPNRYRNYDLYNGYKVVMNDYRGNAPYSYYRQHKMKYAKGYRGQPQRNIGENRQRNYNQQSQHTVIKQHGNNGNNGNNQGQGNNKKQDKGDGNGNGHGNGHGNRK